MKFAFASINANLGVLEALLKKGWELHKAFVSRKDWLDDNQALIDRAIGLKAEIQNSPIDADDLRKLAARGCHVLIVASCHWKIPIDHECGVFMVNFHPSPLPEGRGPYPLVRALLEGRRRWAVSCHKLSGQLDGGDVLDSEEFDISDTETHDTLRLKCQMASIRLCDRISDDFFGKYSAAIPQSAGSYWPMWTKGEQTLHFENPVRTLNGQVRAFGRLGCLAVLAGREIWVRSGYGWEEPHRLAPGTVVHTTNFDVVIAVKDGFFAVIEWSLHAPGAVISNVAR